MTISAGIENDGSKTHLDGLKVKWIIGDQIKVYDNAVADGIVFTSKTLTDDDQTANFTCDIETGGVVENGRYWAVYPTSGSFNTSTEKFSFKVSETQSYNNGVFDCASFPMVAYTTKGSNKNSGIFFYFKHACGVLKIAATGNTQITSVKLTDNNNKLCGDFTVDANAENLAGGNGNTITMNASVTLSSTPTYFYFILPAGALSNGFTLQFLKDGQDVKTTEYTGSALEIARSTINTATIDATKVHYFSVSSTKKVIFASANLYYNGGTWGLYDNEWDFSTSQSSNRGLFMFSDQNSSYGLNYVNSYTEFKEWGDKLEEDGWRTLTKAEWAYLLQSGTDASNPFSDPCRTNARLLCRTKVTVHRTKGMVIMPDGWSGTIEKSYTDSEWDEMKAQGAVFLPATYGVIHNLDWANWYVLDESGTNHGWYWCSDSGNPHWGICFDSNNNQPDDWWNYHNYPFNSVMDYEIGHLGTDRGCAVRLVKDVQ